MPCLYQKWSPLFTQLIHDTVNKPVLSISDSVSVHLALPPLPPPFHLWMMSSTENEKKRGKSEQNVILLFPGATETRQAAREREARMVCHRVSPNTLLAACP